jgi:hypothetical protein
MRTQNHRIEVADRKDPHQKLCFMVQVMVQTTQATRREVKSQFEEVKAQVKLGAYKRT